MAVAELIPAAAHVLVVPLYSMGFDLRNSSAEQGLHLQLGSSMRVVQWRMQNAKKGEKQHDNISNHS